MSLFDSMRVRYVMIGAAALAVVGTGFAVSSITSGSNAAPPRTVAQPIYSAPVPGPSDVTPSATESPSESPSSEPPSPAAAPSTTSAAAKPKPKPAKTTKPAPKENGQAGGGSVVEQVLAHINQARSAAGLPAYTLSTNLSKASSLHNQLMINGCGLEHRCPGEADLGDRFEAQGVNWSAAAENIGFGSAGSSDAAMVKAANGITDGMLAEKPPNDGHRRNLLSKGLKKIGLAITRDSRGRVWVTQDFVN